MVDRSGAVVGMITPVADREGGSMVVAKIDGKLVSIPQASLIIDGKIALNSQTKARILAAAAAH